MLEEEEIRNKLVDNNQSFFEEYFVGLNEVGGIPITKDNFENMFDGWVGDLTLTETKEILDTKSEEPEVVEDDMDMSGAGGPNEDR